MISKIRREGKKKNWMEVGKNNLYSLSRATERNRSALRLSLNLRICGNNIGIKRNFTDIIDRLLADDT